MFARTKKSGNREYLRIVENRKVKGKVRQRVIAAIGRLDRLQQKGRVETLIRSLSRFSENALMIISGKKDVSADAKKIGPAPVFERLRSRTGIRTAIRWLAAGRKFEFDVERAVFLTVPHRLTVSGSDRFRYRWRRDRSIDGIEGLEPHHLHRAMSFLGEVLKDQKEAMPFAPRRVKDLIEEPLFFFRQDMFSGLDPVFFDTTSIHFEGKGGKCLGKHGFSKDHRPDLKQMVAGVVIDDKGYPICCEMRPGDTADVKTLIPILEKFKKRFKITKACIAADLRKVKKI